MKLNEDNYPGTAKAVIDYDGHPAAIVAVSGGEPLVLLVPEETMNNFNAVAKKLGFTHTRLANRLRTHICAPSPGVLCQFCWQSVTITLREFMKMTAREIKARLYTTW